MLDDPNTSAINASDAYLGIGWSLYNLGDDYAEAAEAFTEATLLDPFSSEAVEGLGYARQKLGDIEGAQEAYERVLQLDPDNQNIEDKLDQLRYAE
jgi:Flp pilus assembly protein TadD